jgi:hypothetical protein
MRYSWQALMLNQFEEQNPPFTPDGTTVLQYYGFNGDLGKWASTAVLLAFFSVWALLSYAALSCLRFSRR